MEQQHDTAQQKQQSRQIKPCLKNEPPVHKTVRSQIIFKRDFRAYGKQTIAGRCRTGIADAVFVMQITPVFTVQVMAVFRVQVTIMEFVTHLL